MNNKLTIEQDIQKAYEKLTFAPGIDAICELKKLAYTYNITYEKLLSILKF
jgi:hypothetical protein